MVDYAPMKTFDVAERILHFNQDRHPELLRMKLERLRQDAFVFFRGTCRYYLPLLVSGVYIESK